ncbi:MAG: transposase [Gammaproteobacteria bacterium]|nr:transposase [Gammaproteobacteria bacterium]
MSKGKADKRYEFGVKASITVTNRSNFIVGGQSLPGKPYEGNTLRYVLSQTRRLTGSKISEAFVDKGYRGHAEETTTVYLSGQKRGVKTRSLRARQKRRQAIEPIIGHLKSDGRMGRNYLQGIDGDAINVLLCCAGHNLRLILRHLRIFWPSIWQVLRSWLSGSRPMVSGQQPWASTTR